MDHEKGNDRRVIHEFALGRRRIDLMFVYPSDIVGVEIKGPRDSLGDGRLALQLHEYSFWLPEVWLAIDAKWHGHAAMTGFYGNLLIHGDNMVLPRHYEKGKPNRDEMCCSRLLDLLWNDEVRDLGFRHRLITKTARISSKRALSVKGMLARMLTGHEIIKDVCGLLRSRPMHMVGIGSTEPIGKNPNPGLANGQML